MLSAGAADEVLPSRGAEDVEAEGFAEKLEVRAAAHQTAGDQAAQNAPLSRRIVAGQGPGVPVAADPEDAIAEGGAERLAGQANRLADIGIVIDPSNGAAFVIPHSAWDIQYSALA